MGWFRQKQKERGRRALERQLAYQEQKALQLGGSDELRRTIFLRSQAIRQKLSEIRPVAADDRILEVGSGAHGLIFGFGSDLAIGIDPLAVEYKRLFPAWQSNASTIAAFGEELPFADSIFDVVLSDNVIDHAERPVEIIDEMIRVLKPGGIFFFTVNVHHPVYDLISRGHGLWNALGIKIELSPFADHTVHFSEAGIRQALDKRKISAVTQRSTVADTRQAQRKRAGVGPAALLRKMFFKNAVFEMIAIKDPT